MRAAITFSLVRSRPHCSQAKRNNKTLWLTKLSRGKIGFLFCFCFLNYCGLEFVGDNGRFKLFTPPLVRWSNSNHAWVPGPGQGTKFKSIFKINSSEVQKKIRKLTNTRSLQKSWSPGFELESPKKSSETCTLDVESKRKVTIVQCFL